MNSREIRKLEAIKHNLGRDEKLAYLEDKARDPKKYCHPESKQEKIQRTQAVAILGAMAGISATAHIDRLVRKI
tara:strand:+ start:309 stop:530 length:222 start_codon:yes stop_codon:yes gene_type:complete